MCLVNLVRYCENMGTAVAQLLRFSATNRKVAGSIPDGVSGIFDLHNPSDRTMTLGSTQPLTEMSNRSYFLGVKAAGSWDWQPHHHPVPFSCNLGTLTSWNPLGHSRPATGLLYLYLYCESIELWMRRNRWHNMKKRFKLIHNFSIEVKATIATLQFLRALYFFPHSLHPI
jgi:hypothetical protein